MHGDPRVGRAEEAEHRVATVVEQRCRERQRRVVCRLEPELEDERGGPVLGRLRPLVESQAEEPRGTRPSLETAIDPVRESPLERAEAGVQRELGIVRGKTLEKDFGCARARSHQPVAETDAGGTEPIARDLVDRAGVEVVNEGVRVAVERIGADCR